MALVYTSSILFVLLGVCMADLDVQLNKKPDIISLHIHSDITYRYSTTKVTSRMKNKGEKAREALFDVTLPNEAFITNLTIEIDGNITVGEIKEKEVARKQYEAAKERGESAGYIGTRHRETNKFVLAITVAPLSKISFNLTYQELLKRKLGFYEHVIFIDPGQTVPDLDVTVSIVEALNITKLNVPAIKNDVGETVSEVDDIVAITQPTANTALVRYAPSVEQQRNQSRKGIVGRFTVQYDVHREYNAGEVMMVNGYFIHFFAPEGLQPIPNDVLFILDVSGSMDGVKLAQLKTAMLSNLQQLLPGDRFNMMRFSSRTLSWRATMADVTDEDAMEDAKSYVKDLKAGGWTDINSALVEGLSFLANALEDGTETRVPIIVFLTDGEPTKGEKDPAKILSNVADINEADIPIFTLAFGESADWNFVNKLALQNNGFGRKIYEASDAALQIMGFYNEISVTLLTNVTFNYLDAETANVTKTHFNQYFNGSEVVICGRLPEEPTDLNVSVSFRSAGETNTVVLSGEFGEEIFGDMAELDGTKNYEEMTEKVWAYLTIKQLLKNEKLATTKKDATELKNEVLRLSLKYGFVTPLTSMVVTKDEELKEEEAIEEDEFGFYGADADIVDILDSPPPSISQFISRYPEPVAAFDLHDAAVWPKAAAWPPKAAVFNDPVRRFGSGDLTTGARRLRKPQAGRRRQDNQRRSKNVNRRRMNKKKKYSAPGFKSKGKRKQGRNRNKNKNKSGKRHRFPLVLSLTGIPQPLCFKLYNSNLTGNNQVKYRLHSSADGEVTIDAVLCGKSMGRGKSRRAAIKEIIIGTPTTSTIINRKTMRARIMVSWNSIIVQQKDDTKVIIEINTAIYTIVLSRSQHELFVFADQDNSMHSTDGLLGQIFFGTVQVARTYSRGNKKSATLYLDLVNKRVNAMQETLESDMREQDTCLVLSKDESYLYDMQDAMV